MTTKRVLIIGGYGAVGREAASALVPHMEVQVAGRRPERARPVPGTTAVRLDLSREDPVLDGVDAVLMCAENGNARVAQAALERGIGYADISATPAVIDSIAQLHPARGTAVLSVGLAPGVTNLLARHIAARAPGSPIRIGVLLGSGERHGRAAVEWTVDGLGHSPGSWEANFPQPYGKRTVHDFPFAGMAGARAGLALDSRPTTALLGALNRPFVAGLLQRRPGLRRAAVQAFGAVHLGSDGFAVTVQAGAVTASFQGRRQSRATGLAAARVIRSLPDLPPGIHHIDQVIEPVPFLTALAGEGFEVQGLDAPTSGTGASRAESSTAREGGR
ncbi:saccharopine dehydrogenase [Actinoplanes sp. NBC_00393]|uniref:saccharopine dehydrogenase n=1 Tax=Actinoplanes sp. NBC_00393 TaxID=2975953 RepID=UPI002E1A79D3